MQEKNPLDSAIIAATQTNTQIKENTVKEFPQLKPILKKLEKCFNAIDFLLWIEPTKNMKQNKIVFYLKTKFPEQDAKCKDFLWELGKHYSVKPFVYSFFECLPPSKFEFVILSDVNRFFCNSFIANFKKQEKEEKK